jgi:hypothetical protein
MKITGNEPAMPCVDTVNENGRYEPLITGLTIRQQVATAAMQGLLANYVEYGLYGSHESYPAVAEKAVEQADLLIKALNETPNPNE